MFFNSSRCSHKKSHGIDMEEIMESKLFRILAVGTLVYIGAKTIHRMVD